MAISEDMAWKIEQTPWVNAANDWWDTLPGGGASNGNWYDRRFICRHGSACATKYYQYYQVLPSTTST